MGEGFKAVHLTIGRDPRHLSHIVVSDLFLLIFFFLYTFTVLQPPYVLLLIMW